MDAEMGTLTADLDEMASEASLSEEKAQRAMIDAARLADELRGEQDLAQQLEREHKLLEAQVKDMQSRVDEAMTKMDTRIRELESELDAENRRQSDAQKNMRKSERKIKELSTLCPFAGSSQSPNGPLVLTQILLVFPLEFLDEMVNHSVIEIFTSQVGISGSRFDFENSIFDSQNRDIKSTTTQIENK